MTATRILTSVATSSQTLSKSLRPFHAPAAREFLRRIASACVCLAGLAVFLQGILRIDGRDDGVDDVVFRIAIGVKLALFGIGRVKDVILALRRFVDVFVLGTLDLATQCGNLDFRRVVGGVGGVDVRVVDRVA